MKKSFPIILLLFLLAAPTIFGQSKDQDIRTLLNLTGADRIAIQTMDAIIPEFQKIAPEVPPSFWDDFRKSVDTKSLVDLIVPIYARYYSDDEVRQLIAFYRTPLGQKVIKVTPAVTKDSFAAGQAWGEEIAKKLLQKVRDAGYKVSQLSIPKNTG